MPLQPAPSTQRAIAIVRLLAEHSGETYAVAELARRVGQSRATCQAVLLALESADWVRRGDSGGYTLGAGLIAIGAAAQRGTAIVELLRSAVDELHVACGHEVIGYIPAGSQLVAVARSGPTDPFTNAMTVGQAFRLAPPFGLAFAAWDRNELDRWIARAPELSGRAETRLRKAAALVCELGYNVRLDPATRRALQESTGKLSEAGRSELLLAIAQDGHLISDSDHMRSPRLSLVSAPIFGPDRRVVALMGIIFGPTQQNDFLQLTSSLREATRGLAGGLSVTPRGDHEFAPS
jgi:DNA-binding IclR family transcriptional regulator